MKKIKVPCYNSRVKDVFNGKWNRLRQREKGCSSLLEMKFLESSVCQTRYPILLIHGTGFRDWKRLSYWGRIPRELEKRGAQVFLGGQDGWATVEQNAAALKKRVEEILVQTGSSKIHLIAHSKGGLDARYLVSSLGMGALCGVGKSDRCPQQRL